MIQFILDLAVAFGIVATVAFVVTLLNGIRQDVYYLLIAVKHISEHLEKKGKPTATTRKTENRTGGKL